MRILARVASEKGENPFRRKGKGSSALLRQLRVSRGLRHTLIGNAERETGLYSRTMLVRAVTQGTWS